MDHVNNYKPPKEHDDMDEETKQLQKEGCAPKIQIPVEHIKVEQDTIVGGVRLPARLPIRSEETTKPKHSSSPKSKKVKHL